MGAAEILNYLKEKDLPVLLKVDQLKREKDALKVFSFFGKLAPRFYFVFVQRYFAAALSLFCLDLKRLEALRFTMLFTLVCHRFNNKTKSTLVLNDRKIFKCLVNILPLSALHILVQSPSSFKVISCHIYLMRSILNANANIECYFLKIKVFVDFLA